MVTGGGKRVFFSHGHMYGVKVGLEQFLEGARNVKADIALFGHTHRPMLDY